MNNYLLSYNPHLASPTAGQVLNHVQVNRFVRAYYHPFSGTYVLKSETGLPELAGSLRGLFEYSSFMLTQLNSSSVDGTLPQGIWHWINFGEMPPPPPPPPPPPQFGGGLLGLLKGGDDSGSS